VTVALLGRSLSATVVDFQMALAAAAFYTSGWRRAAVITNGSRTDDDRTSGGWLLLGDGLCLYPLFPHGLVASAVYDATASALNLGPVGGAGKLMGLAAYGRSAFFDARFVGNAEDLRRRGLGRPADDWLEHVRRQARAQGYDLGPLALPERMTEPINADLAASTQAVFEETVLAAANTFAEAIPFDRGDIDGLCLAGAAALNCPANTRLFRDGPFRHLWVPPWCDDSGAAAGAALALFHNILGLPRGDLRAEPAPTSAYLGIRQSPTQVEQALLAEAERVIWTRPEDWARAAAEDLAAGRIIAWFEGRSEVGPRALGHRSLLADPRQANNWPRVNRIKGREAWRPLAPAVLAEEAAKWFEAAPLPSPFMLFTARVLSDAIPAATHVDGSARVQTVGPEAGAFRRLLEAFYRITGVPIVLNTSLNGPGEPIVETPADALALFLRQAVDALYMEGIRVRRR
jgi:carbamoyltransferase